MSTNKVYKKAAVGGTFDRLHEGHKLLLEKAANVCSEELTIGISDKEMLKKKKFTELIEPFEKRKGNVIEFVESLGRNIRLNVVPLAEPMGPTATDSTLEALIVTEETVKGGDSINEFRKAKGFPPLHLVKIDLVENREGLNPDDPKLSSTSLREKEWREMQKQHKL